MSKVVISPLVLKLCTPANIVYKKLINPLQM